MSINVIFKLIICWILNGMRCGRYLIFIRKLKNDILTIGNFKNKTVLFFFFFCFWHFPTITKLWFTRLRRVILYLLHENKILNVILIKASFIHNDSIIPVWSYLCSYISLLKWFLHLTHEMIPTFLLIWRLWFTWEKTGRAASAAEYIFLLHRSTQLHRSMSANSGWSLPGRMETGGDLWHAFKYTMDYCVPCEKICAFY